MNIREHKCLLLWGKRPGGWLPMHVWFLRGRQESEQVAPYLLLPPPPPAMCIRNLSPSAPVFLFSSSVILLPVPTFGRGQPKVPWGLTLLWGSVMRVPGLGAARRLVLSWLYGSGAQSGPGWM